MRAAADVFRRVFGAEHGIARDAVQEADDLARAAANARGA
jgi:hypothetical protein